MGILEMIGIGEIFCNVHFFHEMGILDDLSRFDAIIVFDAEDRETID